MKGFYHGFCSQIRCSLSLEFLFVIFMSEEDCLDCFCVLFSKARWKGITKHEIVFQPFCFYCIIYRCAHTPISCLIHLDITFLNHGEWGAASTLPCQAPNNLIWAHFLLSWVLFWKLSDNWATQNQRLFSRTV